MKRNGIGAEGALALLDALSSQSGLSLSFLNLQCNTIGSRAQNRISSLLTRSASRDIKILTSQR